MSTQDMIQIGAAIVAGVAGVAALVAIYYSWQTGKEIKETDRLIKDREQAHRAAALAVRKRRAEYEAAKQLHQYGYLDDE